MIIFGYEEQPLFTSLDINQKQITKSYSSIARLLCMSRSFLFARPLAGRCENIQKQTLGTYKLLLTRIKRDFHRSVSKRPVNIFKKEPTTKPTSMILEAKRQRRTYFGQNKTVINQNNVNTRYLGKRHV